jgi:hypothetical protein
MIICRDWAPITHSPGDYGRERLSGELYGAYIYDAHSSWRVYGEYGRLLRSGDNASMDQAKSDADAVMLELGYVLLNKGEEEKAELLL